MANIFNCRSTQKLMDENHVIACNLQFSQKCIQLLEKYRKCLMDFKNSCFCEQNIESGKDFSQLEEDYKHLIDEQIQSLSEDPSVRNIKTENIDVYEENEKSNETNYYPNLDISDDEVDNNSNDIQGSDDEFEAKIEIVSTKRMITRSNGQKKKRKKYVYHNYVCDWIGCEKKYSKKDDLMAHISSCHTNEKPFKCEICSKSFAIEKFLKNHEKKHFDSTPKKSDIELAQNKTFVCDISDCGKAFNSVGNLKKHQNTTHSDERPYVCEWPGCSAAYKIKESLMNHRAIHSDERQFKCDVEGCPKTFQTKWNYYSHMKAHRSQADPERARKYPCDWPGCQFNGKSKQDLTIHMNRHMNVKPYKCQSDGCEMSYFTSYELKQHKIKVHEVVNESEREFKCHIEGCQKRYAVERDLKRHLRRHDRIYVCSWPECGQRYAAKQLLSDHMDRHMNVKSFHCHFVSCGKSFFSKTNYESHMKKIHKYYCNKNNKK